MKHLSRLLLLGAEGAASAGRPSSPSTVGEKAPGGGGAGRLAEETDPYTVRGSDTLTSVAARFDTTPSELASLNKLHSRLIFPGQVRH